MVEAILRDAKLIAGHWETVGGTLRTLLSARAEIRRVLDIALRIGQQHHGLAIDRADYMPAQDRAEFIEVAAAREFAAEFVQLARAAFAVACDYSLAPTECGEPADDQTDHQHRAEGNQVLGVRYRERVIRRHEQEIEQQYAEHAGQHRGSASEFPCRHHCCQQVEHDHVDGIDMRRQQQACAGRQRHYDYAFRIRGPVAGAGRRSRRRDRHLAGFAGDHRHIDMSARTDQFVDQRARETIAPSRLQGLADDDLADVALARKRDEFRGHAVAAEVGGLGTEFFGELERLQHAVARLLRQSLQRRRLDVHGQPLRMMRDRETTRGAHHAFGQGIRPDAHQQTFARDPGVGDRMAVAVFAHRRDRQSRARRAGATRSGCPCGRIPAAPARFFRRRKPCPHASVRASRRAAGRSTRLRRRCRTRRRESFRAHARR